MFKKRDVPILVFLCCGLAMYAMFDRYAEELMIFLVPVGLAMGLAYQRIGKKIHVPRSVALMLVILLIVVLNYAMFARRVPSEQVLVFFLTTLIVAKSFMLGKIGDYGQLMFLSVLGILASGAYYPTHTFGLIVGLYTIVAGYTLYRFHLLSETVTHLRMQSTLPTLVVVEKRRGWFGPFLGVALITVSLALVIFSFIPRQGPNWSLLGDVGTRVGTSTGFTQEMILGQMADTLQDRTAVLRVRYLHDRDQKNYNREIYLRGLVLTNYFQLGNAWKWVAEGPESPREIPINLSRPGPAPIQESQLTPDRQNLWRITYEQPISQNLFVIDRPVAIGANQTRSLLYNDQANTLATSGQPPEKGFTYELLTEPVLIDVPPTTRPATTSAPTSLPSSFRYAATRRQAASAPYSMASEVIKPVPVESFRTLAMEIIKTLPSDASPEAKAQKIEAWLKSGFGYTLNNTDVDRKVEPVYDFLNRRKHGHCEYFSAAFVLLARSLGIPAQIVIGFKGGLYNSFGDYYLVRNCDAHSWAEVYSPHHGWLRFDPTPGARDEFIHRQDDVAFKWFWDLVDLVQYSWFDRISSLVNTDRKEFMKNIRQKSGGEEGWEGKRWPLERFFRALVNLIKGQDYESVWLQVLHTLVALLILVLALLVLWIGFVALGIVVSFCTRYFHRRWEERFGSLWFCPVDFYRRVLLGLANRGLTRTNRETAHEFARRVGQIHPAMSKYLRVITKSYLAVRFGKRRLTTPQRRRVNQAAQQIQTALAKTKRTR